MQAIGEILMVLLSVAWWVLIVHIIIGWLVAFNVLNMRQPVVAQIYFGLNRLLEPLYSRIRQFLPDMGGLDLAPLVALLGVYAVRIILINNASAFY